MSTLPSPASAKASGLSLDRLGIVLSTACAIHCILMPFALGALAYAGAGWVASELAEWTLLGSALFVALMSLVPSYRKHRNAQALALFIVGLLVIVLARAGSHGHGVEFGIAMALGGSLIAIAHYRNHRLCSCCHATP